MIVIGSFNAVVVLELRLNTWQPVAALPQHFQVPLKSGVTWRRVWSYLGSMAAVSFFFFSSNFQFFHLFFPTQVAGCELFGDTVGGKGKINYSPDSRPNDRMGFGEFKG